MAKLGTNATALVISCLSNKGVKEMENEMTHAERMGLNVGDRVLITKSSKFYAEGEIRTFIEDDGTKYPFFSPTDEQKLRGLNFIVISLDHVKKLEKDSLSRDEWRFKIPHLARKEEMTIHNKQPTHNLTIVKLAYEHKMDVEEFHKEIFQLLAYMRMNQSKDIEIYMPCPDLNVEVKVTVEMSDLGTEDTSNIPVNFRLEDFKKLLLFLAYTRAAETNGIDLSGAYSSLDEVAEKLNIESPGRSDFEEEEPPEEL